MWYYTDVGIRIAESADGVTGWHYTTNASGLSAGGYTPSRPWVVDVGGGTYHMWYKGHFDVMWHALSSDGGFSWTEQGPISVDKPTYTAFVANEWTVNYSSGSYTAWGANRGWGLLKYTSGDGQNWVSYGKTDRWPESKYWENYTFSSLPVAGYNTFGPATDPGPWPNPTNYYHPYLPFYKLTRPAVVAAGGQYHMYFGGNQNIYGFELWHKDRALDRELLYATSMDGMSGTNWALSGVIFSRAGGASWRNKGTMAPVLIGTNRMWFAGRQVADPNHNGRTTYCTNDPDPDITWGTYFATSALGYAGIVEAGPSLTLTATSECGGNSVTSETADTNAAPVLYICRKTTVLFEVVPGEGFTFPSGEPIWLLNGNTAGMSIITSSPTSATATAYFASTGDNIVSVQSSIGTNVVKVTVIGVDMDDVRLPNNFIAIPDKATRSRPGLVPTSPFPFCSNPTWLTGLSLPFCRSSCR